MNKKALTFLGGTAGFIFALSACSGDTYEYTVSGDVVSQQIDYKCPKGTLSMEAVAFTTGKHKSTRSGSSSDSGTASSPKPTKTSSNGAGRRATSPSPTPTRTASATSTATPVRTATPTPAPVRNKGVTLSSKPDKAEKLRALPKALVWHKGCKVDDYEIFVVDKKGDLYEQDVRKADYNNCARAGIPKGKKYKLFPLCTKG